MGFLNQFASYFTSQEQETELYKIWSAIGVNMEKAFLEEQNKVNTEFTDINNFSEDTMRSWLAFFLQKIPYRTTATSQVSVSLNGNYGKTEIPQYSELTTSNGVIYTLLENIILIQGDERTVTAAQGKRVIETGTYHSIIKIHANNPDLSYLTVKVGGVEIPEVSYETSYDQLSILGNWKPQTEEGHEWGGTPFLQNEYGKKGDTYLVIADGKTKFGQDSINIEFHNGDLVVYDGEQWQRSAYTNKLNPIQFANTYAVPRNGYFAYYYNNYLYIKVFAGSEITIPNGQSYEVTYIQSDGIQGQIKEDTLSFVSSFQDVDENTVKLNVKNTSSTVAVNEPSVGKLGLYLKQRLYSSINVSSVPEYTAWFNAQPEVGDCLVLSDYERWVRTGKQTLTITGIVDIYLVDPNGDPLDRDTKSLLLDRLEPYKDIAVVQISDFVTIPQSLQFEYSSSTSENSFEQFVKAKASQYYNLSYLQSKNASLFDNLDLTLIIKDILETSPYDSTGLILRGYHYKEITVSSSDKAITEESYANEKPGNGYYLLSWTESYEESGEIKERTVTKKLVEVEDIGSDVSAYIYDVERPNTPIGTHIEQSVSIDLTGYKIIDGVQVPIYNFETAVLQCYWGMENEGILSIGNEKGLRQLASIEVKKV